MSSSGFDDSVSDSGEEEVEDSAGWLSRCLR
jgi:hypothetical protein